MLTAMRNGRVGMCALISAAAVRRVKRVTSASRALDSTSTMNTEGLMVPHFG